MRRFHVVLVAALLGLSLAACNTDLQKKLNKAKDLAANEVPRTLGTLLEERRARAGKDLPTDMGDRSAGFSAAVQWRADVAAMDTLEQVESLQGRLQKGQNPAAEKLLADARELFRGQRYFWIEKKRPQDYEDFLLEYTTANPTGVLAEEAAFERLYLHVANLWEREKYDEDTRLTAMARYWKLAFGFPNREREPFMDYVTRLCKEHLGEYCKPIPWELRPEALEKPYLEALRGMIADFQKRFPESIYNRLLASLERQFAARAEALGSFVEQPRLAESVSSRDCVGRSILELGPDGVRFEGEELAPFVPGYAYDKKDKAALLERLAEILWGRIEQMGGTDPFLPLLTVVPAEDVPVTLLADLLTILGQNRVDQVALCGRKRNDGSNHKTMHLLTLFPQKNPKKKEVVVDADGKIDKTTKAEPLDSEKFLKLLPAAPLGARPTWIGYLGRLPVLDLKGPSRAYAFATDGWKTAPVDDKGKVGGATDTPKLEPAALKEPGLLTVPRDVTLDELFRALDGVKLECGDPECRANTYLESPVALGWR